MDDKADPQTAENGAWRCIEGVWRRVYGSFPSQGASIEWHDLRLDKPLPWSPSFHENSLEICLNFAGQAVLGSSKSAPTLRVSQAAAYHTTGHSLRATRSDGVAHRFLTFEFSPEYLARQFAAVMEGLKPEVRRWMEGKAGDPLLLDLRDVPPHLLVLREHVLHPPVPPSAYPVWYEGKLTELLASFLFKPNASPELFCQQQHRLNRELTDRILHLIERDMVNPPSLEMIAKELDRSPFQLSRIFSETTGQTIPATLRKFRMERAAALLRDTRKPVTEIAFKVGYSSIGAFNKAFSDQFNANPTAYRKKG